MPATAAVPPLFNIILDTASAACPAGIPLLGGETSERIFPGARAVGKTGGWELFATDGWLLGAVGVPVHAGLEAECGRRYQELLGLARGRHLCRIWNYVPKINGIGADGLENYRTFCRSRSGAFERHFGGGFKRELPAASAVGTDGDRLVVVFAASAAEPRHFENPRQVPAYEYPAEHGPCPPSFARATSVEAAAGRRDVFVSGTAAIRGHATVAPGDTAGQLVTTLENLRAVGLVAGLGDNLGAGACAGRHLKVYLRHAPDHSAAARMLEREMLQPGDRVSYLRADICRAELNVEIELTVMGATGL